MQALSQRLWEVCEPRLEPVPLLPERIVLLQWGELVCRELPHWILQWWGWETGNVFYLILNPSNAAASNAHHLCQIELNRTGSGYWVNKLVTHRYQLLTSTHTHAHRHLELFGSFCAILIIHLRWRWPTCHYRSVCWPDILALVSSDAKTRRKAWLAFGVWTC